MLSFVWGLCGAGFGHRTELFTPLHLDSLRCLFEPWQMPDGTISGLYDEEDEDYDEDEDDDD